MLMLVLMLMLMLVYLNSRDHCIKHYLEDGRSTLCTFAADPDADDKSSSPQCVLTLMMLILSLMMRLMMMLMIKGSSSPQEVSLSLLPTNTRCFVDLAEERSVYQTRPNVLEGPRDWSHCLRQHQPKDIRVKN